MEGKYPGDKLTDNHAPTHIHTKCNKHIEELEADVRQACQIADELVPGEHKTATGAVGEWKRRAEKFHGYLISSNKSAERRGKRAEAAEATLQKRDAQVAVLSKPRTWIASNQDAYGAPLSPHGTLCMSECRYCGATWSQRDKGHPENDCPVPNLSAAAKELLAERDRLAEQGKGLREAYRGKMLSYYHPGSTRVLISCACLGRDFRWKEGTSEKHKLGCLAALAAQEPEALPLRCPECIAPHIDKDEWATKPHRTHLCEYCGHKWRPKETATVGVPPNLKASGEEPTP